MDEVSMKSNNIDQKRKSKLVNITNLQNIKNHILENRCLKFYFQKYKSNCQQINSICKFKLLGCRLIGKLIKNKIVVKFREVLENIENNSRKLVYK